MSFSIFSKIGHQLGIVSADYPKKIHRSSHQANSESSTHTRENWVSSAFASTFGMKNHEFTDYYNRYQKYETAYGHEASLLCEAKYGTMKSEGKFLKYGSLPTGGATAGGIGLLLEVEAYASIAVPATALILVGTLAVVGGTTYVGHQRENKAEMLIEGCISKEINQQMKKSEMQQMSTHEL